MVAWLFTVIGMMRGLGGRALALRDLVMTVHGLTGWRGEVAFCRLILPALWPILGFALTRSPPRRDIWRARVKARLRLHTPRAPLIDPRALPLDRAPEPATPIRRIVIVIPIYNAHALLHDCLRRVVANTDLPWHLVCVDDGSTDPRVGETLRDLQSRHPAQVTLAGWANNRGFVAAANHGLSLALERTGPRTAIILLNSDAFLPPAWASRLTAPFAQGPQVATVSPLSNDAEILSVPVAGQRVDLLPSLGDAVDRVARRLPCAPRPIPTALGFCMAIAPDWLRRVGLFDPAFGRGYGEEVDWSQRARRLGGVHLAISQLFVTHQGGGSFGAARKPALVRENHAIITRRYPRYDAGVAHFMATDPLATPRIALALAQAGALAGARAVPVYLAHSGGGGADIALQARIAADLARGLPAIVLRVGGAHRFALEVVLPTATAVIHAEDWGTIGRALHILPLRRMIYSCGVGDPAPLEIPRELARLIQPEGGAEMWFHDYFPLSPGYTLLDADGVFRGLPDGATRDPAHLWRAPFGQARGTGPVPLAEWRAAWRGFAEQSDLVAFSRASLALISAAWPDLATQLRLRPHALPAPQPAPISVTPTRAGGGVVLGVLGNLNTQKGAEVVQILAHRIARAARGEPGAAHPRALIHLGRMDPAFAMPAPLRQWPPFLPAKIAANAMADGHYAPMGFAAHGPYHPADIQRLALRYGITHWLIPSIWPETFCFALHEALATGLPVLALDIGAQGDALCCAANGVPIPYPQDIPAPDLARAIADTVCATLDRDALVGIASPMPWAAAQ